MVDERAVNVMLGKEGLHFLKSLAGRLSKDPEFLNSPESRVGKKVEEILSHGGIHLHQDIFEREWREIVKEAMVRFRAMDR